MLPTPTLFAEALRHHRAGRLPRARELYCDVLRSEPDHADAWHFLGLIAHQAGDHATALVCLDRARPGNRDSAAYHANLGLVYRAAGRLADAADSLRHAVALDGNDDAALGNLGVVLMESGRLDEAAACHRRAAALRPESALAHTNLGNVLKDLGRREEALVSYENALRYDPESPAILTNLGGALLDLGRLNEAEVTLRRAVALGPDLAEAHSNQGNVLRALGRLDEALASHRRAVELHPGSAAARTNLANTLMDLDRLDEAIAAYEEALRLRPDHAPALTNLAVSYQHQGRVGEALAHYRRALALRPDSDEIHTSLLFCLNYDPESAPADVLAEHARWGKRHPTPPDVRHDNDRDPDRPLRVGYVSPDLRGHAVAFFLEPILANHDPARVEAFCYAEVVRSDAVTERLRGLARGWRSTCGLSDDRFAEAARADGIDILVDLAGHTSNHRLRALARKPAPVQITYLGYPNTTGLAAMDYRLTDAVADPPGAEGLYTEQLVRLDGPFCCFAPSPDAPPVAPLPALRNGHVTFGSPHNLGKLNGRVFDVWGRVLHALPTSRLLIFRGELTGSVPGRIREEFRRRDVAPERVELRAVSGRRLGYAGYLRTYDEIDICLDTFPANAGTTACEALWQGVPFVALRGDRFFGRMMASLQSRPGLDDWVAVTPEDYVRVTAEKANDLGALASLRAGLRERLRASSLCDGAAFTRGLEAAYRAVWRRWCERKEPVR